MAPLGLGAEGWGVGGRGAEFCWIIKGEALLAVCARWLRHSFLKLHLYTSVGLCLCEFFPPLQSKCSAVSFFILDVFILKDSR